MNIPLLCVSDQVIACTLAPKAFSYVYAVIQVDFTYFLVYFHVFMSIFLVFNS